MEEKDNILGILKQTDSLFHKQRSWGLPYGYRSQDFFYFTKNEIAPERKSIYNSLANNLGL